MFGLDGVVVVVVVVVVVMTVMLVLEFNVLSEDEKGSKNTKINLLSTLFPATRVRGLTPKGIEMDGQKLHLVVTALREALTTLPWGYWTSWKVTRLISRIVW